jgi:hypothetical protein
MQEPSIKTNKGIILTKSVDYLKILQNAGCELLYRQDQLVNALKNIIAETGIAESRLGLPFSLDSRVEFPLPSRDNRTMIQSNSFNADRLAQTSLAADLLNFQSSDSVNRLGTQMHEFDQMMN